MTFKLLINFIIILNNATVNRCSNEFLTSMISCLEGNRPTHGMTARGKIRGWLIYIDAL